MVQERLPQLLKEVKPLLGPINREAVNLKWILEIHSSSLQTGLYKLQSLEETSYLPMIEGNLLGDLEKDFDMLSFYRTVKNFLIHTFRLSLSKEVPLYRGNPVWINMESIGFNIKELFVKIRDFGINGFVEVEDRVEKRKGYIFLQNGYVVSATLGQEKGEKAFRSILRSLLENVCLLNIYELSNTVLSFLLSEYKNFSVFWELEDAEKTLYEVSKAHTDTIALLVSVALQDYGYKVYMDGKLAYEEAFCDDAPFFELYFTKSFKTLDFFIPEDYLSEDDKIRVLRSDEGSTIIYFCPACWSVISQKDKTCPNCGYDLTEFHKMPYEYKLLMGLEHPILEMRMNVIHTIGMKNLKEALPQFEYMAKRESNPILLLAIVDALAKMTHPEALELLRKLSYHSYPLIRSRARHTLEKFIRWKK
ncbi:MAG: HEAT repeat domain-containing protein [Hydrogenobacter sp.]|uniref:HEAT repeat domain-containing protein n=1 Tax=Hydrogenobacter thermophilus TaxID=940 RepID=UPI0030F72BD1